MIPYDDNAIGLNVRGGWRAKSGMQNRINKMGFNRCVGEATDTDPVFKQVNGFVDYGHK